MSEVVALSPTVFKAKGFRFFFFSNEEERIHIHVKSSSGEAKFWLDPAIEVAVNYGLSENEVNQASRLIKEHEHEIRSFWQDHFKC
jgi:hypothetical protein